MPMRAPPMQLYARIGRSGSSRLGARRVLLKGLIAVRRPPKWRERRRGSGQVDHVQRVVRFSLDPKQSDA